MVYEELSRRLRSKLAHRDENVEPVDQGPGRRVSPFCEKDESASSAAAPESIAAR